MTKASHTTVIRAWNNVSTFLHDQTTHRQSIWEARIKMILLYHAMYISEAGSVRVLSGYEEDTQRTW